MGTKNETPLGSNLLDALFPVVRQRVLGVLFGDPSRSVHTNEVIKRAASGRGAVQRELIALVQSGLFCENRSVIRGGTAPTRNPRFTPSSAA